MAFFFRIRSRIGISNCRDKGDQIPHEQFYRTKAFHHFGINALAQCKLYTDWYPKLYETTRYARAKLHIYFFAKNGELKLRKLKSPKWSLYHSTSFRPSKKLSARNKEEGRKNGHRVPKAKESYQTLPRILLFRLPKVSQGREREGRPRKEPWFFFCSLCRYSQAKKAEH